MRLVRVAHGLTAFLFLATAAAAQEAPLKLADLEWLAGGWTREFASFGPNDVLWTPPVGGQILGMSRSGGKFGVRDLELISIVEEPPGKFTYRVRHFSPDLKGGQGEEKQPLDFTVSRQGNEFVLQGVADQSIAKIVISRQGADRYTTVVQAVHDGESSSSIVGMKRKSEK